MAEPSGSDHGNGGTPEGDPAVTQTSDGLGWLLDDLVERVPSASKAVVLSVDGLLMGSSRGLPRDEAEHMAAIAAGFQSLARGTTRHFNAGPVRQTIVEMESAFLFVSAAGHGACLAVYADAQLRHRADRLRDGHAGQAGRSDALLAAPAGCRAHRCGMTSRPASSTTTARDEHRPGARCAATGTGRPVRSNLNVVR